MRNPRAAFLLCASALAVASAGHHQWTPSPARDMTHYQAREANVDPATGKVTITGASGRGLGPAARGVSSHKDRGVQSTAACGEEGPPGRKDRIVGGEVALPHQWPWQVAIHVNDAYYCGGSLISPNYVLTAAHCMEDAEFFIVLAGAHDLEQDPEPHRFEIFSDVGIPHPDYQSDTVENDIALIELPAPVPLDDYIKLACLPERGDTMEVDDLASVTGWGAIHNHSILHTPLLHMVHDMPAISYEDCLRIYVIMERTVVCLSGEGGKGPCKGDSGGPMIRKEGGQGSKSPGQIWTQHGVVSFGPGVGYGCESNLPNGFTRTESYLDWIESVIS